MAVCTNAVADARPTFSEIADNMESFNAGDVEPGKMSSGKKSWDNSPDGYQKTAARNLPPTRDGSTE